MGERKARTKARESAAEEITDGLIRLGEDTPPTRVQTSVGVVLVIEGVSPTTYQMVTDEAARRYSMPAAPKVEIVVDPNRPDLSEWEEVRTLEEVEFWAQKEPERYGTLKERFLRWQRDAELRQAQQAGFLGSELIRCGVSVDADATAKAGAQPPDFEIGWRDKVPYYALDEDGAPIIAPTTDWERYLVYAIPGTLDWGEVSAVIMAKAQAPTGEGVAVAVKLFRGQMASGARRQLARFERAQSAQAEAGEDGDQSILVGPEPASSASLGDDAG